VYNYIFFSRFSTLPPSWGNFQLCFASQKREEEETSLPNIIRARARTHDESRSLKSDNNDDNKTETSEKLRAFHHLSQYA